jgi:hypothetical protein
LRFDTQREDNTKSPLSENAKGIKMLEQVVSTRSARGEQKETAGIRNKATGIWQGQTVTLQSEKDVDDEIMRQDFRQKNGLDNYTNYKTLEARTVTTDARTLRMPGEMLAKLSKVFGSEIQTTKLAQSYLKYFMGEQKKPPQQNGLNHVLQHYIALHKLSSTLAGNDSDFVARMTPLPKGNPKLEDLSKELQQAGDNPEKLQEILEHVAGFPEDPAELHRMMKTLRFNLNDLKSKLRSAQNLPKLDDNQTKQIREKVEDALLQLELDEGTRIKAARNSVEKGFDSGEPEQFIESYSSALQHTGNFLQTFTLLVQRHKPSELSHVIPLMKQALADELRLDQEERSTEKIKLESLMSELSFMHISSTLIEKIRKLVSGMQRIYGESVAA